MKTKTAKELLQKHKDHISCDYGIKQFNKTKRSKKFVEELNAGKGKPKPPPPPPPSPTNPPAVVFLDFDGGVVSGTAWNVNGDIIYDYSGLTYDEQQQVMNIVASLFGGFNVKITNDEAVFNAAPSNRKMKAIFTETWSWYGKAGGVAFKDSMFWTTDEPCWVFTSLLGYIVNHIGAAGTHEPGHTIGLNHHSDWDVTTCQMINPYSTGNGVNSYIMGNPYSLPPIWVKALSSISCTNMQDDKLILATKLQ